MWISPPAASMSSGLPELDRGECLRLLAGAAIGRLVFTHAAMPAAHPVNFLVDGDEIVFRTCPDGPLLRAVNGVVVGFQADDVDPATRTGWSVLAVGEAYEITDPQRLAALGPRLPTQCAPGRTAHTLAIPTRRLTGRALTHA
ncbi:pyridoxamine 5'-phosphate oxidase family protein [Pseudonocardia sp. D17]|uniref:pyridoxamine 5'-phosphate oxidase family protein n=1 Tax=Pseudonocardia sp. D17 TaxID=882661 RepID=UPI002B3DCEA1|nr:pyridoxamine 5'-phosphate oxidase [Pseudonocardia sp. D17]